MEKTIKFGVIGCGLMGREFASASMRWLHLQTDLPRPQIIAACSRTDKSLDWFRRVPDTRYFYHDYHELQYKEGVGTMTAVLQDEMRMSEAMNNYLTAYYKYKVANLSLLKLTGQLDQVK